jgi:hypothetical protein
MVTLINHKMISFMHVRKFTFLFIFVCFFITQTIGQIIPSPKEHFGFSIGDDYMLANYTNAEAYFKKLAAVSDRVILQSIGKTEEGRDQYIMIISSPENLKKIDQYKTISQKMARAEGLNEEDARKLSQEGKPVVWIDGGLHSNEVVATQQLIELYYQLLSRKDKETLRILDNVIILLSQVNPDGQELMSNWYMQEKDPKKRNMNIPRLYQKYIGHDNNRDFYMNNMSESENISRQQYIEWMPQIIYNHHQTSPAGAVVAGPPYRDPFNFAYDPLLITSIDGVGASMINRLNAENKPGFTRLSGSPYSTWWNGGLRTTPYFHNMIGILTEITGSPAPTEIPVVPERLIPDNATPNPITPQPWKFRKSIDYSISLSYAVMDYASRNGDLLLYNIYRMGKNSIDKGNTDNWTLQPKMVDSLKRMYEKSQKTGSVAGARSARVPVNMYDSIFKDPSLRDARAYIIPADQADFPTAIKFVNALIKSGILVHQANADFNIGNKKYPAGSYVVKTNQAFRPHVIDMFEPQDHPNDFQYPGGPPVRPYDAAGWTLAYQMGVEVDRVLDDLNAPLQSVGYGQLQSPIKKSLAKADGYLLSSEINNSFIAVNDLLKAGVDVFRTPVSIEGMPAGSFYVSSKGYEVLNKTSANLGVNPKSIKTKPSGLVKINPARIALFDQYGGSMPSGWVRWIMEQYHFPFQLVYPKDIDAGKLNNKYDAILFISGGIPAFGRNFPSRDIKTEDIPKEFHHMLGAISVDKSIPQLKLFMEKGGNIITVGSSTALAYHLDLPIKNAITEIDNDGNEIALAGTKYYIPGSILKAEIDTEEPANWGMARKANMVFNNSPVFNLTAQSVSAGIKPLAWYGHESPLKSGWAWGQSYIKDGVAAFVAPVGKGKLYAYGSEITFRAQSHNTFKMLFNQLYRF